MAELVQSKDLLVCNNCGMVVEGGKKGDPHSCQSLTVLKVEKNEQGIFTYVDGWLYPYRGYPDSKIVQQINILKRVLIKTIGMISSPPIIFFLPFFFLFQNKIIKQGIFWFSSIAQASFQSPFGKFLFPELDEFSQPMRELIRKGQRMIKKTKEYAGEYTHQVYTYFLLGIIMLFEFDNAYRYPLQDVLGELNRENLRKNPYKEIERLFRVLLKRDNNSTRKEKWKSFIKVGTLALWLMPSLRKFIIEYLLSLDLEEIELKEYDWYWVCDRWDYDFGGVPYKERHAQRVKIEEENKERMIQIDKTQDSTFAKPFIALAPNDRFFELSESEAKKQIDSLVKSFFETEFKSQKIKLQI